MTQHRKWLGLLALMPATAMVFTDQAILPVALPTIQKYFNTTAVSLWWCINSYLLLSAILLLAGGKVGDWIGHRKAFLWGMVIFAISSALCGLSPNVNSLIAARALQGVGAALLLPTMTPLFMALFPQSQRGTATGINASVGALFLVSAPFIGGYFTQFLSWRWIFWVNLPIAAVGILLIFLFIPPSPKGAHRFDLLGFCFFAIFSSSLIIWIMQGEEWGWLSIKNCFTLILSIISAFFLLRREKKAKHPFIDLSLFRHPIYRAANISLFAVQFVLMITVYRAIFFQEAFGWSPLQSGTIFFVTSLPLLFMSLVGGFLADRFGSKIPLALGFCLLIFSFAWLPFFVSSTLPMLVLGFVAFSIGVSLIFTPSYSSAMGAIPPTKAGTAFGILATVRSFSASLGVAVIGSLTNYIQMKSSQIHGFVTIHLLLAFLLVIAFAGVFILYRGKASHQPPKGPAEGWD